MSYFNPNMIPLILSRYDDDPTFLSLDWNDFKRINNFLRETMRRLPREIDSSTKNMYSSDVLYMSAYNKTVAIPFVVTFISIRMLATFRYSFFNHNGYHQEKYPKSQSQLLLYYK